MVFMAFSPRVQVVNLPSLHRPSVKPELSNGLSSCDGLYRYRVSEIDTHGTKWKREEGGKGKSCYDKNRTASRPRGGTK